jgi:Fe-S oxidoreductase
VRGINNGFVEFENRIVELQQMRWNFSQIDIETNAEKGFFEVDLLGEFLCSHLSWFNRKVRKVFRKVRCKIIKLFSRKVREKWLGIDSPSPDCSKYPRRDTAESGISS